jgi:hypothetical protein
MSAVRLRRIGREYRNEHYRTLAASSLSNNQRMRTTYVPVMHCENFAVTDMKFRHSSVIEFLVTEGNSAEVIYERLRGVYGDD